MSLRSITYTICIYKSLRLHSLDMNAGPTTLTTTLEIPIRAIFSSRNVNILEPMGFESFRLPFTIQKIKQENKDQIHFVQYKVGL